MFSKKVGQADPRKEQSGVRRSPRRNRLKRFLGTMLLAGSLAFGACDRAAVGDANACIRPGGAEDIGCNNLVAQIYERGTPDLPSSLIFTDDDLAFTFEGIEYHQGWKAIFTFEDGACNALKREMLVPGETKTFVVGDRSYELTLISMTPGQVPDLNWVKIHVGPPGCDESCRPVWECEHESFGFYVAEDTWTETAGFRIEVHEITQDVSTAPDGETCPISNVRVNMTITYPGGESETVELPISGCAMQGDSCYFVNVDEVYMEVGSASGGTCEISDGEALIYIGYPPE